MVALRDVNNTIVALISRGLSSEEIEKVMKKIIGSDWKDIAPQEWYVRLKSEGYVLQDENELSISDLEAFVKGRIKLEDLGKISR